jgi:ubiquinone/menaquinone biosynthesis C-methylase UbiE
MSSMTARSEEPVERPIEDPSTESAASAREPAEQARYDSVADWYLAWIAGSSGLVFHPAAGLVAPELTGQRWLDVACGTGRATRELAHRGASAVGVDIAGSLIAKARSSERSEEEISYVVGDVAQPESWWDGELFDGAICEQGLMDIDDLDAAVNALARVLRAGGLFVASLLSPCFPGRGAGLSSWPPDRGYASEGFWGSPDHNPDGVRVRVGSNHRMVSTYLNSFIAAGFRLERAFEPPSVMPYQLALAWRRI